MYKSFSAQDFRKQFGLPDDYHIEGFLSYGAWDRDKHARKLEETLKSLGVAFSLKTPDGFLLYITEIEIEAKKYWFAVMYGGALLSEMVHLACLFGSKANIHIGSCGGLYKEIKDLDLVVPTWSYGNESTTRVYEPNATDFKHYANETLGASLQSNMTGAHKFWSGPIITNQAMMGETWDDVKKWSEQGYYGVEMKTATVFSISKHFGVPSAALLYVTDNLINGQTVGDESHTRQKEKREAVKNEVYKAGLLTLIGK